jgi:hypothetical protein
MCWFAGGSDHGTAGKPSVPYLAYYQKPGGTFGGGHGVSTRSFGPVTVGSSCSEETLAPMAVYGE